MKRITKLLLQTAVVLSIASSVVPSVSLAVTDPNGDGNVSIADAVFITGYLAGNYEVSNLSALDFNGDYIVSEIDVLTVQYYLAGIDY